MNRPQHSPGLHLFALLTAAATFCLIWIGGLTTSHGAGMAVPDWPTSYGYNMFALPWAQWQIGGIFYEHTHRLFASEVGLLTIVLALWLFGKNARPVARWLGVALLLAGAAGWNRPNGIQSAIHIGVHGVALLAASFYWPRCDESPKWLRRLGVIAVIAVVIQGVLGGLRVTQMKDVLGVFHGTLAQLFLVLICAIALFTSRWWKGRGAELQLPVYARGAFRYSFVLVTGMILLQLGIGATMRHQHAGLAISDFPLAHGQWWPATDAESVARYNQSRSEVNALNPITVFQIKAQMIHRLMAVAILGAVGWVAVAARRRAPGTVVSRGALAWLGLIVAQAALGVFTVLTNKAADVATAHVALGAASLVTGGLLSVLLLNGARNAAAVPGRAEIARPATPGHEQVLA